MWPIPRNCKKRANEIVVPENCFTYTTVHCLWQSCTKLIVQGTGKVKVQCNIELSIVMSTLEVKVAIGLVRLVQQIWSIRQYGFNWSMPLWHFVHKLFEFQSPFVVFVRFSIFTILQGQPLGKYFALTNHQQIRLDLAGPDLSSQ